MQITCSEAQLFGTLAENGNTNTKTPIFAIFAIFAKIAFGESRDVGVFAQFAHA